VCRYLQHTCVFGCVFAPHVHTDDDLVTFATVIAMFSTDLVTDFLHGLSPDKRADPFRSFVLGVGA
jgi:hypothetical protein